MGRQEVGLQTMFEFVTRPIRAILGVTEHDIVESVRETRDIEANMLGAVRAIENATDSIERHVEVIETLATSVDPLRASVDRLADTMHELVAILAPMGAAEHEMQRVGRFFGRHRHDEQPRPEGQTKP
jgi:methyl-accepting chemotaxis protein